MPTAVATGADSGVGNALAQILLEEGYKVYAVDRQLGDGTKRLTEAIGVQVDTTSSDSMKKFSDTFKDVTIDLYVHSTDRSVPCTKDTLETTDLQIFRQLFAVNAYAPMLVTQALIPGILQSKSSKIAIVTSHLGSIADNDTGGLYAYRSSKAAGNAVGRALAVDLKDKKVPVLLLHPGSTSPRGTDEDLLTMQNPHQTASKLWRNVVQTTGMTATGKFFDEDGKELPW